MMQGTDPPEQQQAKALWRPPDLLTALRLPLAVGFVLAPGALVRFAIVVLATAMALQQTGVAQEIVTLAFGAVLGAITLAGAIAFGLGSREAAGRVIDQWLAGLKDRGES